MNAPTAFEYSPAVRGENLSLSGLIAIGRIPVRLVCYPCGRYWCSDKQFKDLDSVLSAFYTFRVVPAVVHLGCNKERPEHHHKLFCSTCTGGVVGPPASVKKGDGASVIPIVFDRRPLGLGLRSGGYLYLGQVRCPTDGVLDLEAESRVLAQRLLGVLPPLRQPLLLV